MFTNSSTEGILYPPSPVAAVPTEVVTMILGLLPLKDLGSAATVCKQWYEAANDRGLWERITTVNPHLNSPSVETFSAFGKTAHGFGEEWMFKQTPEIKMETIQSDERLEDADMQWGYDYRADGYFVRIGEALDGTQFTYVPSEKWGSDNRAMTVTNTKSSAKYYPYTISFKDCASRNFRAAVARENILVTLSKDEKTDSFNLKITNMAIGNSQTIEQIPSRELDEALQGDSCNLLYRRFELKWGGNTLYLFYQGCSSTYKKTYQFTPPSDQDKPSQSKPKDNCIIA